MATQSRERGPAATQGFLTKRNRVRTLQRSPCCLYVTEDQEIDFNKTREDGFFPFLLTRSEREGGFPPQAK